MFNLDVFSGNGNEDDSQVIKKHKSQLLKRYFIEIFLFRQKLFITQFTRMIYIRVLFLWVEKREKTPKTILIHYSFRRKLTKSFFV